MKKALYASVAAAMGMASTSGTAQAALASNAILQFDDGINSCQAGGTYPNCDYDATTVSPGSYFTMDLNSNNNPDKSERTALVVGPDQGVRLGTTQSATGSHTGAPNGSEESGHR